MQHVQTCLFIIFVIIVITRIIYTWYACADGSYNRNKKSSVGEEKVGGYKVGFITKLLLIYKSNIKLTNWCKTCINCIYHHHNTHYCYIFYSERTCSCCDIFKFCNYPPTGTRLLLIPQFGIRACEAVIWSANSGTLLDRMDRNLCQKKLNFSSILFHIYMTRYAIVNQKHAL